MLRRYCTRLYAIRNVESLKSRFCECHDFQQAEGHWVVHAKIADGVNDGLLMRVRDPNESVHEAAVRTLSKH
jgi:hypothetical protein